ncbi:MBL fold metallo-hydrolase [Micromonospora okii]|uniref:MBL fold metallo-hydrolase n=1 Tax=Micromonospora okii TaxID=1182970 RepID=UPI001E4EBB9B|nr:MBL fold metallo-hydrolase [Micromonospora okii]
MPLTHRIGSVTVTALLDGVGPFFQPREEAFPGATEAQWREADRWDPGTVGPDGGWRLPFRAFALRAGDGPVTLVDAGIGPADAFAATWAPVPGRLPAELAAAGIDPAEVRTVVLTHLHTDHVGWAGPLFPNADHLLQRAELAALELFHPELPARLLEPLRAAGRLRVLDGETALTPGVRVLSTPGHTPGHQSVLVEDGDERLLVTGDLLVHAIQLVDPALPYAHEEDPPTARASRESLLGTLSPLLLATPHLGLPFTPHPEPGRS